MSNHHALTLDTLKMFNIFSVFSSLISKSVLNINIYTFLTSLIIRK